VLRAGAPVEREHPFAVLDRPLPVDDVVHSAVAAAGRGRIFVVSLRGDVRVPGLPLTYSQLASALEQRLVPRYRRVATEVHPGILPVEVRVYERRD
jgi:hypothetical protein